MTYDLYVTPEAIRTARDTAEDLLEGGRVQGALALLSGLASEMIIRVDNLAKLLGYGEEKDYTRFREQIAELEQMISGEEETQGVFARLRKSLDDFQASYFE